MEPLAASAGESTLPFDKGLFRKEAVARRGHAEPIDGLLRVTAPHEWMILLAFVLALGALLGWGFLGSIERSLTAECVLVRAGDRHSVVSEVSGSVVEVLVDVGGVTAAGRPIARVATPEMNRQIRAASARLDALESLESPDGAAGTAVADLLRVARAELMEFEAEKAAGEYIIAPHAGEITAHTLATGEAVAVGEQVAVIRAGTDHRFEAVTFLPPGRAHDVEAGMTARVLLGGATAGRSRSLEGEVVSVSARPVRPSGWLVDVGLDAPPTAHRLDLALRDVPTGEVADGDGCRLRIVLRTEAPLRLVAMSGTVAGR